MSRSERLSITDIERALIEGQNGSLRTCLSDAKKGAIDDVISLSFNGGKVLKNILL